MSGQVPGSTIVMPMSCSNGNFQQSSPTTITTFSEHLCSRFV
ncbi:hypothetical protein T4D_11795 [Trichinella pseudospiralis]|uniref:Uncharacterized protein n=1 Tax=Trichinella pseudospiralis TaxID=6337 RepID=A0A0V1DPV3_TRIPS|nr:hypothetical protein T4D_11795 [Trichinella pseudospiralis]